MDDITESVDRGRVGETGAASCEPTSESAATEGAGEGEGCGAGRVSFFVRSTLLSTGVAGRCGRAADKGVDGREDGCAVFFVFPDLRSLVVEGRVSPVDVEVVAVGGLRPCRVPPAPRRVGRAGEELVG